MLRKVIEKTIEMICYAAAVAAFIWIAVLRNFWVALLATLCAVVGLGLLSLPFVIMRFSTESAARRRDLAALAERQGWSYCRKPDEALAARLSSFLGASPSSQYWHFAEAVTGTVNEWDFASFRCTHTFSTGQQDPIFAGGEVTHSYELWVALLPGLREPIPTIRCWPRSDPARTRFPAGHFPEGPKTGNQAFDEDFYLEGPVELLAAGLGAQLGALIPELVTSLGREFSWHLEAGTLRTNDNSLKDDPGILPALLASLAAIADLLRRHGLGTTDSGKSITTAHRGRR